MKKREKKVQWPKLQRNPCYFYMLQAWSNANFKLQFKLSKKHKKLLTWWGTTNTRISASLAASTTSGFATYKRRQNKNKWQVPFSLGNSLQISVVWPSLQTTDNTVNRSILLQLRFLLFGSHHVHKHLILKNSVKANLKQPGVELFILYSLVFPSSNN